MNVQDAEKYIVGRLRLHLPADLYYHGVHHVLDVKDAALSIAVQEGVQDEESLALLKTAALYHDCGFMNAYQNHEEEGCRIAREKLPDFDFSASQIDLICGMIMATKIPQKPKNHLEEIICDADLDYLGRNDFEPISQTLFLELRERGLVSDIHAWNQIQIKFIGAHQYWTKTSKEKREQAKLIHLAGLQCN
ncbi:HD domain-containing protein [Dyadobacter psychrotolerans]|uniref:HD domain-containing protein n=1 Tax=Dyadobacter psychrotolerans TaxID=2541721 RepID=A0A4R5DV09_9BACT|nr:HD domain-containing protein [Dyadobacter psychrotolerans]TDE17637.1 HD domain-containing protein [Dyadobacter psychrotolerans]